MAHPSTAARDDRSRRAPRRPNRAARPEAPTRRPEAIKADRGSGAITARRLSVASAVLIFVGGYVHFCLYRHGYRFIPKIGISFLFQAGSSAILTAALLVRRGRIRLGHRSVALAQLTRLSAIGLSLGTLAALGLAHTPGGLFQFREIGLRPAPQTLIAIVAESLATVLLGVAMLEGRAARSDERLVPAVEASTGRVARNAA
jgi:hypothetical protein